MKIMKKYSCNENYFEEKSLQACYWAGFIAADGCIFIDKTNRNRQKRLQIMLSIKDENHLINFKNAINYNGIISKHISENQHFLNDRIIKNGEMVSLIISSDKLCNDLSSIFNIHSQKSLTHEPPIGLTEEQELAFIIGYIDGDGSIYLINKKLKYPIGFNILGTELFLTWLLSKIKSLCGITINVRAKLPLSKIYKIAGNGKFTYDFMTYLEKIPVQKLNRKWNIVKNFTPDLTKLSMDEKNKLKTHCKHGHEFTEENTGIRNRIRGGRYCKQCDKEEYKLKKAKIMEII
jgi:hypothetical protein